MKRRLMFALVGVALAAVTLVGAGVLLLAQFGARQTARERVTNQLAVVAELTDSSTSFDRIQPALGRLGEAFESSDADLVFIDADGRVTSASRAGGRNDLHLSPDDLVELEDGILLVDLRRSVVGLVRVEARTARGPLADRPLAVLVQHEVVPVPRQAMVWFLVSAAVVVGASIAVAGWLAARFTRPLKEIEIATARIAAGDLETRVEVEGDDELAELGRAVNRMATDLGRSRAAEQEFLMSVSHDLRTPLTAINGYAEALIDGAITDTTAAGSVIAGNAQRLARLVGDLLDLARLSARQFTLQPRPTDAADLARRAVSDHLPRARSYDLALEIHAPEQAPVVADPDRLAQAIGNLIDNALKFARHGVTVTVATEPPEVTISVADDGSGIPPEDLPFVFERLYVTRLKPVRSENSSGLGLAIVRELTAAMGGSVEAESEPGRGTTMTVRLPAI